MFWAFSNPADYASKGSKKPGDPVSAEEMKSHVATGTTVEKLLEGGLIEPRGVTDRSALPQAGCVFTATLIDGWKQSNLEDYEASGSPKPGDAMTVSDMTVLSAVHKSDKQFLLTLGLVAAPGAPHVHKLYKVQDDLDSWCALTKETPQEPLYPIVDPHHHLWLRQRKAGETMMPFECHSFGTRQAAHAYPHSKLAEDAAGNKVVGTVFLECNTEYEGGWPMADQERSAAESKWVQDIADKSTQPLAIVAHLDMAQGGESVSKGLDAHLKAAPNLVGIRHALAWHSGQPIYSRAIDRQPENVSKLPGFREAMEVLADRGLSFDTWLFHTNLPELTELAQACPRTSIICDHVGCTLGAALAGFNFEEATKEWRKNIEELAKCPNVVVKLSGLSMPVAGFAFDQQEKPPTSAEMAAAYKPYFKHCLDCFGPSRCLFASNFPVDKVSGSYTTHWNAFKLLAKELLPDDESAQRALFYDNSVRIYRLDKPPFSLPSQSKEAESLPAY